MVNGLARVKLYIKCSFTQGKGERIELLWMERTYFTMSEWHFDTKSDLSRTIAPTIQSCAEPSHTQGMRKPNIVTPSHTLRSMHEKCTKGAFGAQSG